MGAANLVQAKFLFLPALSWSGGWFVISTFDSSFFSAEASPQRLEDSIYQSASLSDPSVRSWLQDIAPAETFWSAVLSTVHPEAHKAGLEAISALKGVVVSKTPVTWPSPFSTMDLIANRLTPGHRDPGGAATFYDLLVSLGEGHRAVLHIEDVKADLAYDPGTGVFITGRILEHSVPRWEGGERVAVAYYMKDKVHDRLGVSRPALPTQTGWFMTRLGSRGVGFIGSFGDHCLASLLKYYLI
jgi:hypothetical protein